MKIARRAGIVLGSVAAAVATMAAGLPVHAAPAPPWQIAATVHYGPADYASGYSAVIAPAKDDAWVFGGTNPGGTSAPAAEHWNGKRWQSWRLPSGLNGFIVAAAASSADDVWAVGDGYALHWNGVRWAVANTWGQVGEASSLVVINPADVWVFGWAGFSGVTGLGTWHYTGRAWIRATGIAAAIYRASAISRHDIWAITASPRGGSVIRYDGQDWQAAPGAGPALANIQLDDILAVSPHNIWVSGTTPVNGTGGHLVLAHWNGRHWKRFVARWPVQQPERFAADGQGGVWIPVVTGGARPATWILHLSRAGTWTRTRIAVGPQEGVGVGDLALIPGTATLWGTGGLLTTAGGDAAIWEHGIPGFHLAVSRNRADRDRDVRPGRLMGAGRGEVVRVYLTVGNRGGVRFYLIVRGCRAPRRWAAPAWTSPPRQAARASVPD